VLAIQEPYIDYLNKSRALSHYITIYPNNHPPADEGKTTRSLLLVNIRLPTNSWTQIPVDSFDVTAIQICGDFRTIRIFNIY
ncbi:hypothetical protein BT96DRAFT_771456, partial [Gymnopus androsaceus JB14]